MAELLAAFELSGDLVELELFKKGHIHDTWISTWSTSGGARRYIHQMMNQYVFRDIPTLMANIVAVTEHLQQKIAQGETRPDYRALELVPTRDGRAYLNFNQEAWRTYVYIEGTLSHDVCPSHDEAYKAASAFGEFQRLVLDLPLEKMSITISGYDDTPWRYEVLQEAMLSAEPKRLERAAEEIAFARKHIGFAPLLIDLLRSGAVPQRIAHYDTKLNNILFDRDSGSPVCVVDLDTCMAGASIYDFGDLVRNTGVAAAEDEKDLEKISYDLSLFEALCHGYLEQANGFLTAREIDVLHKVPVLNALNLGVRFLNDYLEGDPYFKTAHEHHNWQRARAQFQIVRLMQQVEDEMRGVVQRHVS